MELIKDQYFEGERPLYARRGGLRLENVTIGPGESSLKEGANIEAENCEFNGKYPFWECDGFTIRHCVFREGARAALWYTRHCRMFNTLVEAPKMFRRITGTYLENVQLTNALETFWDCDGVTLRNVEAKKADYIFMHTDNINAENFNLQGNYSFQYSKNVVIRDANLDTKDAFWESENVTVYNSRIQGEFLGWYSKNLRLVGCHIGGTQPLCYCDNLILENCTFEPDADLAFEYSSVQATIQGSIHSVKNPRSGFIKAQKIGQVILDANIKEPGNCEITQTP
jgi:hypothetical protein